ncbi:hypothetical protein [Thomasclavelia sp.]|uniref:hypothetical protein n=1 Tax=Thomasclavelia sp. TaxID=3025757 RepID=UPI0025D22191|nr:hypothetical protein [Thomasclavelia sp.]
MSENMIVKMDILNSKDDLRKIIGFYGIDYQANLAMEECAELIQAVNKMLRVRKKAVTEQYLPEKHGTKTEICRCLDNLTEEIADVEIMIMQLKLMFNIDNEEYRKMIAKKAERVVRRYEEDRETEFKAKNRIEWLMNEFLRED